MHGNPPHMFIWKLRY